MDACASQGQNRSRSSSVSLTVENALGSFDFLNNTDLDDEEDNGEEERAKNDTDGRSGHKNVLHSPQHCPATCQFEFAEKCSV